MTVKTIKIDDIEYVRKDSLKKNILFKNEEGLKAVLIRSNNAGVHFGYLAKEEFTPAGKVVILKNTRRVWYWSGASSLSQMALEGVKNPDDCKFSVIISENEIVDVVETIPLTEIAVKNLYEVPLWKN